MNSSIKDKYRGAINVRLGAEYVVERLRIRAGYALYSTPFKSTVFTNRTPYQQYSGGLGYYFDRTYFDLAYVMSRSEDSFLPYDVAGSPNLQITNNNLFGHNIALTFGIRFR